ncbi:MAG: hypothetical protein AAF658_10390, partial [Myxococcota bacterium]
LNGGEQITVAADGIARFQSQLPEGESFAITVVAAPNEPRQICAPTELGMVLATGGRVTVQCGEPFLTATIEVFGDVGNGVIVTADRDVGNGEIFETLGSVGVNQTGALELPIELPTTGTVVLFPSDTSQMGAADVSCAFIDNSTLTLDGSNPPSIRLLCLGEPEPVYGTRTFGTWIANDGTNFLDATGTACAPAAVTTREDCFQSSLVRQIRIPAGLASSCDDLSFSGFTPAFTFQCASDGTDYVVSTVPSETPIQLANFADQSGHFAFYSVVVQSNAWAQSAQTPLAAVFDNPIVDVSTVSGDLDGVRTFYTVSSARTTPLNLTGAGSALIQVFGGSVSVLPDVQALRLSAPFTHVEVDVAVQVGSLGSVIDYVELNGADFSTFNGFDYVNASGIQNVNTIRVIESSHSLFYNSTFTGGGTALTLQGAGDGLTGDNRILGLVVDNAVQGVGVFQPNTVVENAEIERVEQFGLIAEGSHSRYRDIRISRATQGLIRSTGNGLGNPLVDVRFIDVVGDNQTGASNPAMSFQFHSASRFVRLRSNNTTGLPIRFADMNHCLIRNVTGALPDDFDNTIELVNVTNSRIESLLAWGSGTEVADIALNVVNSTNNTYDGLAAFNEATALRVDGESGSTFTGSILLDSFSTTPCEVLNSGGSPGLDAQCDPLGSSDSTRATG